MAQQGPSVLNGVSNAPPEEKIGQELVREPGLQRPPLNRLDSRSNFPTPYRPPFPNTQQPPVPRPPQIRPGPPSPIPQFPPRPPQQIQRPPNNFQPPPRANFRPLAPFPRPQVPPPRPQLFQQRSTPAFGGQIRPVFAEELLNRSQTVDSGELDQGRYEEIKMIAADAQKSQRSPSVEPKMDSKHGSNESLDRKSDGEVPSRPDSRSMSRMDKIMEDEGKKVNPTPEQHNVEQPKTNSNDNKLEQPPVSEPEPKKDQKKFLDLGKPPMAKSPAKSEGDNDSGVDESTQGNDQSISNGDNARSPRKTSKSRTSSTTPTKGRSLSRGSKTPSIQSPDSNATTPGSTDKKKVPMNKVQVGAAPSPNLKVVKSKIGSLDNAKWKPGGGNVKIESKKVDFKNAAPRIEAKNDKYIPKAGEKKILHQKLQWNAKSKIGSLDNATYKPKGGEKKIESIKLDFKEKAKSKVGSKDNIKHTPGGGDIKGEEEGGISKSYRDEIESKKLEVHAQSKIGSMDNVKHRPKGGEKRIFDDKDYLKQKGGSINHSLSGSQNSLPSQPDHSKPIADENLNQEH